MSDLQGTCGQHSWSPARGDRALLGRALAGFVSLGLKFGANGGCVYFLLRVASVASVFTTKWKGAQQEGETTP